MTGDRRKKLILCMVDSLRTDMLERTVAEGRAPTFGALLERGTLIPDCVSAFPSVTPVCSAEMVTGEGAERHWISGMNWYHRAEHRYVEYGSSLEATRTFGLIRTLYDIVYNMNMAHLSPEVGTVFERLADAGLRTACTPFLVYRGRTRHELGLEGMLRRVAVAATFRHATWGPDELFYGELYASRRVPCKPTLARPGTRDDYSTCASRELLAAGLFDFLLFSLPDNDHHSHRFGPEASVDSIAHADDCLDELVAEAGGMDEFLDAHAVIVVADHAQTAVERELPLATLLGEEWSVLQPSSDSPSGADLAVSPIARAAGIYLLGDDARRGRLHAAVRERLLATEGIDLVASLDRDGRSGTRAVVSSAHGELSFAPGLRSTDLRGRGWRVSGDDSTLDLERSGGRLVSGAYPDALGRLWSALNAPHAGDLIVSLADGWECVDWGGASHVVGGSHGALLAGDSLGPLLLCGFETGIEARREQWSLRDVNDLVLEHFGIAKGSPKPAGDVRALS